MDYNSDEFKKGLCGLIQECTSAEIISRVQEDATLHELKKALETEPDEQKIEPKVRRVMDAFEDLIMRQTTLIRNFEVTNGIDPKQKAGWRGLLFLLPFLFTGIEQELKNQGYANKTLGDLVLESEFDDRGLPVPNSALAKLFVRALKGKDLPSICTNPVNGVPYPLDKVSAVTYGRSVEDYEKTLEINVAKSGSDKAINVTYAVNFEALDASVSRSLSHFDKQVCIAAAAHYAAGNIVVSLSQIYTAMGNNGRPSPGQIAKIGASIDKLAKTEITIDNTEEAIAYKGRKKVVDKEMIIACKRRDAYINGHLTKGAIFMYDLPAPIRFARDRGQIITLDLKVLQSPMNKTEENLILQDYLIRRISRKGDPRRILISTLLSKIGARGSRQKKWRAQEKVKALLEYYKEIGFIAGFKLEPDAICIEQPVKKRIPAASR